MTNQVFIWALFWNAWNLSTENTGIKNRIHNDSNFNAELFDFSGISFEELIISYHPVVKLSELWAVSIVVQLFWPLGLLHDSVFMDFYLLKVTVFRIREEMQWIL